MKKVMIGLLVLAFGVLWTNLARAEDTEKAKDEPAAAKTNVCYACDKCHAMSLEAGKCPKCGKAMKAMHVVAVKDGKAYCCPCGADCKCEMKGDDMKKCSCGKTMTVMPLKGKYVCGCGEDCKCNTISDKPGKCGCGKDLKLVE